MIIVSAFYVVCWLPTSLYKVVFNVVSNALPPTSYYPTIFLAFFYVCVNPFIYAMKFEPIKRILLNLFPARNPSVHS